MAPLGEVKMSQILLYQITKKLPRIQCISICNNDLKLLQKKPRKSLTFYAASAAMVAAGGHFWPLKDHTKSANVFFGYNRLEFYCVSETTLRVQIHFSCMDMA